MKLETIKANLEKTIQGKKQYKHELTHEWVIGGVADKIAVEAMLQFLDINIQELQNILDAVNQVEEPYDR